MSKQRLTRYALFLSLAALISPLGAQQAPAPSQPNPNANAANPPTPPQPSAPANSAPTPPARAPVIPRRIPAPAQPPAPVGSQVVPPVSPQAQLPVGPQPGAVPTPPIPGGPEAAQPESVPAPGPGQRRLAAPSAPGGGMVSLNFNRADLIEIIHIIAQQLRLTYTIDPEVKGTVTINSAEPLRAEDLLPIFHQLLRMNGAVAVRTGRSEERRVGKECRL